VIGRSFIGGGRLKVNRAQWERVFLGKEAYREFALQVFASQDNRCAGCGLAKPLQLHHEYGRGIGGAFRRDVPEESLGVCQDCHPNFDKNRPKRFVKSGGSMSEETLVRALNRLAKWRQVFAGWQLGTRLQTDAECQAVRDHREVTIFLRAENNALLKLMLDKGVFTLEEYQAQLEQQAEHLNKKFEEKFPGMKATDYGIEYETAKSAETMKGWRP
jgi:hypothetical protein